MFFDLSKENNYDDPTSVRRIVGINFGEDNKIKNYIYENDDYSSFDRKVFMDEELVFFFIEKNRQNEIEYTGEFDAELTIKDSHLFKDAEPIITYEINEDDKRNYKKEYEILSEKVKSLEEMLSKLLEKEGI